MGFRDDAKLVIYIIVVCLIIGFIIGLIVGYYYWGGFLHWLSNIVHDIEIGILMAAIVAFALWIIYNIWNRYNYNTR